ncbi:MAG: leucine-rich repeat domain-containing protein [Clostridia bacterium]|nr:leucine-rich repeat domain-containing protein [Clostridia bacterium]
MLVITCSDAETPPATLDALCTLLVERAPLFRCLIVIPQDADLEPILSSPLMASILSQNQPVLYAPELPVLQLETYGYVAPGVHGVYKLQQFPPSLLVIMPAMELSKAGTVNPRLQIARTFFDHPDWLSEDHRAKIKAFLERQRKTFLKSCIGQKVPELAEKYLTSDMKVTPELLDELVELSAYAGYVELSALCLQIKNTRFDAEKLEKSRERKAMNEMNRPDLGRLMAEEWNWKKCDGGQEITGYRVRTAKEVFVPDTIAGKPVVSIGKNAFFGHDEIHRVNLPDGIKYIEQAAFERTSLQSIQLTEGLERIGKYALGATSLTSITVPESVTELNNGLCKDCIELKEAAFKCQMASIPYAAFMHCIKLTKVIWPKGLKEIQARAFIRTNLQTPPPKGITIRSKAFQHCTGITSLDLTGIEIESSAFAASSVEEVIFSDLMTFVPEEAFKNCDRLRRVVLPKNVQYICARAFAGCTNLEEVVVQGSGLTVDEDAFKGCSSLRVFPMDKMATILSGAMSGTPFSRASKKQAPTGPNAPEASKKVPDHPFTLTADISDELPF